MNEHIAMMVLAKNIMDKWQGIPRSGVNIDIAYLCAEIDEKEAIAQERDLLRNKLATLKRKK
jgi:hypothetical protein